MKKILKIIIVILISFFVFLYFSKEEEITEKKVNYQESIIQVLDKNNNLIFEYSIEELNNWAKNNWHIFEKPPQVGLRDVDPNFYNFDNTISISPDFEKIAFSVHDYSILIYTSFIGIINTKNKQVSLIKNPIQGNIEQLIWSNDSVYLAYTSGTARAQGDYLGVVNTETLKKEFVLSEKEVKTTMPEFKDLFWEKDKLFFTTHDITWSIKKNGSNLERKTEIQKELKEIVLGFLGTPYQRGPLDEELLYRTDVFDCTTLVLASVAYLLANDLEPETIMKKINYYPDKEISYENRLHFSTYRNKILNVFQDITKEIAPNLYQEKQVILNKERIIDIDWQEPITLYYIEKKDIIKIIDNIPEQIGIGFLIHGDEKIGLDIRHEGFLFDKKNFIHASLNKGKVVQEDFFEFLEKSNYDGVLFFQINEI